MKRFSVSFYSDPESTVEQHFHQVINAVAEGKGHRPPGTLSDLMVYLERERMWYKHNNPHHAVPIFARISPQLGDEMTGIDVAFHGSRFCRISQEGGSDD